MINRSSFCHHLTAALFLFGLQFTSSIVSADGSTCGENTGNNICADDDNFSGFSGDPGSAPNSNQPSTLVGNPINLITGNKHQRESDFRSPSTHLAWNRSYNSANAAFDFGLGRGWSATYHATLNSRHAEGASLVQSDGRQILFGPAVSTMGREGQTIYRWRAHLPTDGTLHNEGEYTVWSLPDGRALRFKGRLLVEINYPGAAFLKLYYSDQRLTSVTDELGQQLQFEYYPAVSQLRRYSEASDSPDDINNAELWGAANSRLKTLTLPDGGAVEYDYDQNNNLRRVRFPDGTTRLYHYENPHYPNHLTGLTDRLGERIATWGYSEEGYAVRSELANGVETTDLSYQFPPIIGGVGSTTVTNSLGEQSVYTWQRFPEQGQSLLLSTEGVACHSCPPTGMTYTYSNEFQLASARHESGLSTRWEYDKQGRTTAIFKVAKDASERLMQAFTYQEYESNNPISNTTLPVAAQPASIIYPSINPDGQHEVVFTYNEDGLPVSITEHGFSPILSDDHKSLTNLPVTLGFSPIERTSRLEYINGKLSRFDGPRTDVEDVVVFEYHGPSTASHVETDQPDEPPGTLASVSLPSGERMELSGYNRFGQPTELRLNSATPYLLEYDQNQRVKTLIHRGNKVQYHYNAEGHVIGVTDPNGRHSTIDYDAAGRLVAVTDDVGQQMQWLYDTESRQTGEKLFGINGEEIRTLSLVYDQLGLLANRTEARLNHSSGNTVTRQTGFSHNSEGQLIATSNLFNGKSVTYNLNPFGDILSVTAPYTEVTDNGYVDSSSTTGFEYDSKGRLTSVTDARENTTSYLTDDFHRRIAEHSPDTGTTQFSHDSAGNTISKINANNDTTTFAYDAANRPVSKTNRNGTTHFRYHPENGQLVETSNASTTETFEYNLEAQLSKHTRLIDGHSFATTYDYDSRGRINRKGLPDGTALRYHYYENLSAAGNNSGQLRAITKESWFGFLQETLLGEIDLDARDGTTRHISHNGRVTEKLFHPDGTLQSISVSDGLQLTYRFDDHGQIESIDRDGTLSNYGYLNGRLSRAFTTQRVYQYRYDKLGNRLQHTETDNQGKHSKSRYVYTENGDGNRLMSINDAEYVYDATGIPIKTELFNYIYNAEKRPIKVYTGDTLLAEYQYNSFGERIKKVVYGTSNKKVTYFLYDNHKLTAEVDTTEESTAELHFRQTLHLGHAPTVYLDGNHTYSINSDHLGTPLSVSNVDGETVWSADYSPFGKATITTEQIQFAHRFPGQYFDPETDTHYNYFRDYDPATGRYLSNDPIGLLGGNNRYGYVGANPLANIDFFGLDGTSVAGAVTSYDSPSISVERAIRIGGQLGQWAVRLLQATTTTAGSSVAGPVVAIAMLATYFINNHAEREADFIQQFGYQPTRDMYDAIYDQVVQFNPQRVNEFPRYNGFDSIFRAVLALERAQRDYIHRYERDVNLGLRQCEPGESYNLYVQALNAIEQADIARAIQHDVPTTGTREEFPIVDSEVTILVTPGEPHAEIINEGFPTGIDIASIPTAGGYIFVPADQDAADQLGIILGTPITPDTVINTTVLMNEDSSSEDDLHWGTWDDYPKVIHDGREYAEIGGRLYTRHAVDRMQPSGLGTPAGGDGPGRSFPPNLVEHVINNGSTRTVVVNGVERTIHSLGSAEVVTEQNGRIVVTVNPFSG